MPFHPGTFWETAIPYRLVRRSARGGKCRCGTVLAPGASSFGFERLPRSLEPLLRGREFCGVLCARAFLLETLATMEDHGSPSAMSDVEEILASLRFLDALIGLEAYPSREEAGSP